MNKRLILALSYVADRGGELSTWLGVFVFLGYFGLDIPADKVPELAQRCVAAFGVIAAIFPDDLKRLKAHALAIIKGEQDANKAAD